MKKWNCGGFDAGEKSAQTCGNRNAFSSPFLVTLIYTFTWINFQNDQNRVGGEKINKFFHQGFQVYVRGFEVGGFNTIFLQ